MAHVRLYLNVTKRCNLCLMENSSSYGNRAWVPWKKNENLALPHVNLSKVCASCIRRGLPLKVHPDPLGSQRFLGLPFLHNVKVTPSSSCCDPMTIHIKLKCLLPSLPCWPHIHAISLTIRWLNSTKFVICHHNFPSNVSSYHFILVPNCSVSWSVKHLDLTKISACNTVSTRHLTMCIWSPRNSFWPYMITSSILHAWLSQGILLLWLSHFIVRRI